jgi:hypothetical protein
MTAFTANYENNTLPNNIVFVQGLYAAIHSSLIKVKLFSIDLRYDLGKDENVSELVTKFLKIHSEIGLDVNLEKNTRKNPELIKPEYKTQLDEEALQDRESYNEVANATIQEQDV